MYTSSVAIAEIGESPDVAEADGVTEASEEVLDLATPRLSVAAWVPSAASAREAVLVLSGREELHEVDKSDRVQPFER